jgi:hypothetical protein
MNNADGSLTPVRRGGTVLSWILFDLSFFQASLSIPKFYDVFDQEKGRMIDDTVAANLSDAVRSLL